MKTGNKNQAVILAIVAVGAIAFLATQLMPSKRPAVGSGSQASVAGPMTVKTDFSLALLGDPFSHPKLAAKKTAPPATKEPKGDIDKEGNLPVIFGPRLPGTLSNPDSGSGSEENTGDDREKQQGPQISLVGVMDAGTPVAMLAIGGKDAQTFRQGAKLAKDVWLLKIGDGYVEVLVGHDIHRIETGQTYGVEEGDKQ